MLPLDGLLVTRSRSVMLLVAGFVESPEDPLPSRLLTLTIDGDGTALTVNAKARGYLDDAVQGENFRAILEFREGQWEIVALGRQTICARGSVAGKPGASCP